MKTIGKVKVVSGERKRRGGKERDKAKENVNNRDRMGTLIHTNTTLLLHSQSQQFEVDLLAFLFSILTLVLAFPESRVEGDRAF